MHKIYSILKLGKEHLQVYIKSGYITPLVFQFDQFRAQKIQNLYVHECRTRVTPGEEE